MIHAERTHGGVKLRVGAMMAAITNEQALQLADRLYALAGAADAEDVIDYPEADREASRADREYQFRKEQEAGA